MSAIRLIGPTVSPVVVKVLAAADDKAIAYTHTEYVSIKELGRLNSTTGKVPVAVFDNESVISVVTQAHGVTSATSRIPLRLSPVGTAVATGPSACRPA